MTQLFGVVGHPVGHSMSPAMHNAAFKVLGLDADYVAFDVASEKLGDFIEQAPGKGVLGLNVTVPHKVAVMEYVDELSREAELVGAVNTLKFGKKVRGYNTDGVGFIRALADAKVCVKDKKVLLLGAGGAAKSIAFSCALEGAGLVLSNRTGERAEALASEVGEKLGVDVGVAEFDAGELRKTLTGVDVLVNATSVGMHPGVTEAPVPGEIIPKDVVVADIVYNPIRTRLLEDAQKGGCETIGGVGMLVQQGAESLRIWLGVEPPVDVMREAVVSRLTG